MVRVGEDAAERNSKDLLRHTEGEKAAMNDKYGRRHVMPLTKELIVACYAPSIDAYILIFASWSLKAQDEVGIAPNEWL